MTSTEEQIPTPVVTEIPTHDNEKHDDPSDADPSKELSKDQRETSGGEKEEEERSVQSFKTNIIISGIIVAVVGAIFAITKKLRHK
ncbi:hypothetical protein M569_10693 [Genlisea aurea]|uniref:Uncharacterized protein n=1 Tax=Genlisea aurea TaxID=192259 RepID=S8DVY6_9LAMI|nr:hypothetical protein M569_10693 [Genlisea aurea]